MCGRFSLGVDTDQLIHEFHLAEVAVDHQPRFNLAPTQDVPAVVSGDTGLRLGSLRWGLVPSHSRDMSGPLLINARSETVDRKPAFADSFRRRRCWVLADGFYEWVRGDGDARLPYHIRPAHGRPFAFAAIWDRWRDPRGEPLVSCAILTTDAAPRIA
ncbi:MAG TPA: SOS response-associated peptidase, partial [Longimicrobiales bacterium]|nr:SOS response-associated peptidase [Longimicrobiales bacterium]